jgi:streptogramin lyase
MVSLPFTDVATSPFFCQIAGAFFSGLTNGTSATTYSPSSDVTREQMAAFTTRTLDQSLKRGSQRAALGQWWTPATIPSSAYTFVSGFPLAVTSDGTDLWAAASGSVERVRASDGKLLDSYLVPETLVDVVIAHGHIYAAADTIPGSQGTGRLYRIDPRIRSNSSSPSVVTDGLGNSPRGIIFDGSFLWVSTFNGGISRVDPATGNVTSFTNGVVNPVGILFDGTNVWVTDFGDNSLKRLDLNGNVTLTINVGVSPNRPIFDGTNIWIPNTNSDSVTVVRASTGMILATLTGNGLNVPWEAAFDGERILVTNFEGHSVSLWRATDLTPLGSFSTGANTNPSGACSDGLNFWVVLTNIHRLGRF